MALKKPKVPPQFADLKGMLAQSKQTDPALYQTIHILLDRLQQFQVNTGDVIEEVVVSGGGGGGGGSTGSTPTLDQSFITVNTEASLPNERKLVAGANITLDTAVAGEIKVIGQAGTGSGGMEYLGDYVPGTYNDGDVVVWTDGITYICTKNGTTTPPEPWPSGGLATSDGSYWTVTPHAGLANERALSLLASGYVKSTVGEPSTVATIPLTDTTGILPDNRLTSNVALKNIKNQFIQAQRISNAGGDLARLTMSDLTMGPDLKTWEINLIGGGFNIWALTDNESSVLAAISISRAGVVTANGFVGNGSDLTSLNASNLTSGLVATPRLGSGTADASTFLRGDNTWQSIQGVPSGAVILMNAAACPPGYSRITVWDGYYVRMGPIVTSGGSNTHAHGPGNYTAPAHSHGAGTLSTPAHNHGGTTGAVNINVSVSGSTSNTGAHTHGFSDTFNGNTGGESAGIMNVDGGASGNMARGPHTHSINFTVSGNTSSDGNHSHTLSGSGSGSGTGSIANQAGMDISGNTASGGGVGITGGSDAQFNMPLYVDMLACQKN